MPSEYPIMRALTILVSAAVIGSLSSGCTALKATVHMADAEKALKDAGGYGAEDKAAYEYTMAMRYLEKAKEEISYNEHRVAEDLAKKSQEWSDKAIIFIQRGGRLDLTDEDFEMLREQPVDPFESEEILEEDELLDAPTEPLPAPTPDPEDDFDFDEEEFEMESP
jgi:hypothetical protein